MRDYSNLKGMLVLHEGFKTKPYRCTAGKLTIGVGRNIEDLGITQDEAEFLLENDIDRCVLELSKSYPWFKNLTDERQDVLIDMAFNLGITRLRGFKNMISAVESGDYVRASAEMLNSSWARQVGNRAKTLAQIMERGSY